MSKPEKNKGFLTQTQFLAVFGIEPGTLQRWIKFGLPVEGTGQQKQFDLVQSGQWVVRHFAAGYLSLEQTAEMFGQEVRTITKWKNEFGMPQSAPGFYKRDDVVKWREKYLSGKIKTLQQGGVDGVSASAQLKNTKNEREKLKLMKERRELVNIQEVMPVFTAILSNIRTTSATFGQRVGRKLEGMTVNERSQVIQKEINELFRELANVPHALKRIGSPGEVGDSQSVERADATSRNVRKRTRRGKKVPKSRIKSRSRKISRK